MQCNCKEPEPEAYDFDRNAKCERRPVKRCQCPAHNPAASKKLTELILDCWQREYDVRPFGNLVIHRKFFEERLHHCFGKKDMEVLLAFLAKRKILNLELLYISLPLDAEMAEVFIDRLRGVTWLSLVNVDLPAKLIELLAGRVEELQIKLLRLTGNCLTNIQAEHLRCFVKYSGVLQYLDVGFCCLDEVRFATIADGVYNSKSLKGVDMSRLELHSRLGAIDETKISTIISMLVWKGTLVEVHFKGCFFDCHCMEPISEYIVNNSAILYLDLGSNKIGPKGASILLKAIVASKKLIGLDLSYNQLGSHGGEIVAHCLPKTKIRFLDLSYNGISTEATHLIFSTIKKSTPIRILNIAGNYFSSEVGRMLYRQIGAGVLLLETIDVDVIYDNKLDEFHVVPQPNSAAKYNERYHRTANPFK